MLKLIVSILVSVAVAFHGGEPKTQWDAFSTALPQSHGLAAMDYLHGTRDIDGKLALLTKAQPGAGWGIARAARDVRVADTPASRHDELLELMTLLTGDPVHNIISRIRQYRRDNSGYNTWMLLSALNPEIALLSAVMADLHD